MKSNLLKRSFLLTTMVLILVFAFSAIASATEPDFVIQDGKTQPFVNMNALIHEELWIESPTDSDNDGERDLLYVKITRPSETEAGLKSPALVSLSPYDVSVWEPIWSELRVVDKDYDHPDNPDTTSKTYADVEFDGHTYDEIVAANFNPTWLPEQRVAMQTGDATRVNAWLGGTNWRNYFVSRGYAAVSVHMIGGFMSEGLLQDGGYDENVASAAIVDWLNGRIKGFTSAKEGNGWVEVKADWTNGKVAMNGTSYDGSLPLAAAVTGVEGLETIIPEAPVFSYYDYYRSNGMVWAPGGWQGEDSTCLLAICNTRGEEGSPTPYTEAEAKYAQEMIEQMRIDVDRTTGDYSKFWDERNMARYAENIKCSILMTHGYEDWNVKFKQTALIWEACEKYDIVHKAIFHRGAHQSALGYDGLDIYGKLQGWLDYHLLGIENGMPDAMPAVSMLNNTTMKWEEFDTWPIGDNEFTSIYFVTRMSSTRQKFLACA